MPTILNVRLNFLLRNFIASFTCCPAALWAANDPNVSSSYSAVGSLLQLLLGLGVVVGLIFAASWSMKRLGMQSNQNLQLMRIVSSLSLGQRERLLLVEINEQWLLLGLTPQQINTLHIMPKGEWPTGQSPQIPAGFAQILQKIRTPIVPKN